MGVSVRIAALVLLISLTAAVPVRRFGKYHRKDDTMNVVPATKNNPRSKPSIGEFNSNKLHNSHIATSNIDSLDSVANSQNFFPSFANLFEPRHNHYSDEISSQERAYSQRPNSYRSLLNYPLFSGFRNIDNYGKSNPASAAIVDSSSSVLGSGNFGIIRGGTFSSQNDDVSDFDTYNSLYNNGHGRPLQGLGYIANPRPNYSQDQFANFRDFADINTPSNSAFSHYVVVYANKNATKDEISQESRKILSEPKNILETLSLLDTRIPVKISKNKAKSEATKQKTMKKKNQWNNKYSKFVKQDIDEPLLALS